MDPKSLQKQGILYAGGAYFIWGILPLYWKFVQGIAAEEILAHRIVWSFVFMLCLLAWNKQLPQFGAALKRMVRQPKSFIMLVIAAFLISVNWFIYIWAVNTGHIIEASLGYYINPLVSILLGLLVFKERLNFWQIISVLLASVGVIVLTIQYGSFPWIAITLAVSFGVYGLAKKITNFEASIGLTLETLVIAPFACIYFIYTGLDGHISFGIGSVTQTLLLIGSGIVTAIPLLYFAKGAKLIPLSMIGFLQYIAPTISLSLGVFLFHEHFTKAHLTAFFFIWCALFIFTFAKTKVMRSLASKIIKEKIAS